MLITIDPASPQPLADQVAASVRAAVANGTAAPGDRLPSARNVAATLGINLHTVLRGYQQLRDEGLVELRRGRAAVITETADRLRLRLAEAAEEFARAALHAGASEEEALAAARAALLAMRG
ncbi:DNA-binding transcriptional regulator YhcF (GntR family) [Nonomuraea polychroma]|uniref:DNA-binding transcriptional regulator YhcF (GntR family) n=1 Tax=Nonomuraea polychroma TaxID=46176 RepID=A0A438MHG7_9ACTN|nr:GntR family transcriptional regulator [Nonomuraea polychroma]RVX45214.1 DNA-binding transcriptional regulator YhcF (GntR family) [Nonomuraea polychroma]